MENITLLEHFTHRFVKWAGSTAGFSAAFGSVLVWLVAGALFNYSQAWENGFSIYMGMVTFLMVFVIQRGQIKETMALQIKLNELINVSYKADNRLINVEELTEKEIYHVKEMHQDKVPEKRMKKH